MSNADHIIAIASKNPCMTMQSIADVVGVSRERVRQIANENGLLPYRGRRSGLNPSARRCSVCGKLMGRRQLRPERMEGTTICRSCRTVTLTCSVCLRYFTRTMSRLRAATPERGYRTAFQTCSKVCWHFRKGGPEQDICRICGGAFTMTPVQKYAKRHGQKSFSCSADKQIRREIVSAKGML